MNLDLVLGFGVVSSFVVVVMIIYGFSIYAFWYSYCWEDFALNDS